MSQKKSSSPASLNVKCNMSKCLSLDLFWEPASPHLSRPQTRDQEDHGADWLDADPHDRRRMEKFVFAAHSPAFPGWQLLCES